MKTLIKAAGYGLIGLFATVAVLTLYALTTSLIHACPPLVVPLFLVMGWVGFHLSLRWMDA